MGHNPSPSLDADVGQGGYHSLGDVRRPGEGWDNRSLVGQAVQAEPQGHRVGQHVATGGATNGDAVLERLGQKVKSRLTQREQIARGHRTRIRGRNPDAAEHGAVALRMCLGELQICVTDAQESLARIATGGVPCPQQICIELREGFLDNGQHDGWLIGEVTVDRGRSNTGLAGNGSQRHGALVAVLLEQFDSGRDDLVPQMGALPTGIADTRAGCGSGLGHAVSLHAETYDRQPLLSLASVRMFTAVSQGPCQFIQGDPMNAFADETKDQAAKAASPAVLATEVVLPGVVKADGLMLRNRFLPAPAKGQVLVKVDASGISFAEQTMRRGVYPGQPKFPFVPGYDLVGTVVATGDAVDRSLVGRRVAAMTKTGGWASHVLLPAADLVPVASDLDPAEVETFVVNGVTAWQMLHRKARVRPGQTILVTGVGGAVGTTIAQLAVHHGVRVIGTAGPRHHEVLRSMGVVPLDYNDPDLSARVRDLAPAGVDAVFDHLGGDSVVQSWKLLAPGGTLVSYAIAAAMNDEGSLWPAFLGNLARVLTLHLLPNGKKAYFYDLWAGHLRRPKAFRARVRDDLGSVLNLLGQGAITAKIAARMPLDQVVEAMKLAESRTSFGKVVLVCEPHDER